MRGYSAALFCLLLAASQTNAGPTDTSQITDARVEAAEKLIGIDFTPSEIDSMIEILTKYRQDYELLRKSQILPSDVPALMFNPVTAGLSFDKRKLSLALSPVEIDTVPSDLNDLAFLPVRELSELIRTRRVSSTDLTRMFLARLTKYGTELHCVITLTEAMALRQAAKADEEIASGHYRGPLHGIPYGVKDLFAVEGYPTTYGTIAFKDNMSNQTATVIRRLEEAGAVLVAKLSMGELAWGDIWYGGVTRNPWNPNERSAGSSAGPAAATSAGLVPFAIGTETWGSIVSPSTRCGVTGLRPTYGRVSREGAMSLSWSIDKVGPICRTVEDCAVVLSAIMGPDGLDMTVEDLPFNYNYMADLSKLRVGYLKVDFERGTNRVNDLKTIQQLRRMGVNLIEVRLPEIPVQAMEFILTAEAAASFDELTRSNKDDLLAQQMKTAWPNMFRASRFIPAVEYIQATRLRHQAVEEMNALFETVDVILAPTFDGNNLFLTNLTGHPCVVVPNGFDPQGIPTSVTFVGPLYGEATLLAVARQFQDATSFHKMQPPRYSRKGYERNSRGLGAAGGDAPDSASSRQFNRW
ncbi:MAG: amidase [candidate division Zixibacteria bacterium]|nr:amidase [candidate division Zixibacteria bacterium]